jgi:hypothetical protein
MAAEKGKTSAIFSVVRVYLQFYVYLRDFTVNDLKVQNANISFAFFTEVGWW